MELVMPAVRPSESVRRFAILGAAASKQEHVIGWVISLRFSVRRLRQRAAATRSGAFNPFVCGALDVHHEFLVRSAARRVRRCAGLRDCDGWIHHRRTSV